MKISASTLLFLTGPAASAALQLPFGLENIKLHLPTFLSSRLPAQETATTSSLLALHKSLIEIPSVTDSERPVADFLAEYLTSHNFTVETQAVDGDRVNVFAYLERGRDTNTLITSHIDTVPPFIPYTINGDRIGGRGSNDAKGSVAAQITAVESLIASGDVSAGDISLLYVVSEETTGSGMKTANDLGIAPKTVIFGEPTENKLAVGHKGILMFDVIAHGKASHSGYPELGVNANSRLIKALAVLDVLELPGSELLGKTTLNVGRIEGGVAYNVVPAEARGKVAVRVAGELEEVRRKIEKEMGQFEVELEFTEVGYGPVKLDYDVEGEWRLVVWVREEEGVG